MATPSRSASDSIQKSEMGAILGGFDLCETVAKNSMTLRSYTATATNKRKLDTTDNLPVQSKKVNFKMNSSDNIN